MRLRKPVPALSRLLGCCMLALLHSAPVLALSVSPMMMEISTFGEQSRTNITIANDGGKPLAVELLIEKLSMSVDGKAFYTPADEDILLFPPFAQLPPGGSQLVQVQYVGDPEITQSLPYRLAVSEVPVAVDGQASTMTLKSRIETLVNVTPPGARAQLEVVSIGPSPSGADSWEVLVRNAGNRFAQIRKTLWTIESGGKSTTLTAQVVAASTKGNLVLPGTERKIDFTPPAGSAPLDTSTIRIIVVGE